LSTSHTFGLTAHSIKKPTRKKARKMKSPKAGGYVSWFFGFQWILGVTISSSFFL
jgi:hypothetical protein